jgi:hypothetical protein
MRICYNDAAQAAGQIDRGVNNREALLFILKQKANCSPPCSHPGVTAMQAQVKRRQRNSGRIRGRCVPSRPRMGRRGHSVLAETPVKHAR